MDGPREPEHLNEHDVDSMLDAPELRSLWHGLTRVTILLDDGASGDPTCNTSDTIDKQRRGGMFCCHNPFAKVRTSRSPGGEEVLERTVAAIKG